ncbi:MAG: hypothetical protein AAFS10_03565 [Myxococcota bacterium]
MERWTTLRTLGVVGVTLVALGACTPAPKATVDCPKGTTYKAKDNMCAPKVAEITCDKGYAFKKGEGCVAKVLDRCPKGTSFKKGKGCVAKLSRKCPQGMRFEEDEGCVATSTTRCPKGMRFEKGDGCVPEVKTDCPKGTAYEKGTGCVAKVETDCPKGTRFKENRGCVATVDTGCPANHRFVEGRGCVLRTAEGLFKGVAGGVKRPASTTASISLSLKEGKLSGNLKGLSNGEKWVAGVSGVVCGDQLFGSGANKGTVLTVEGTVKGREVKGSYSGTINGKPARGTFTARR